MPLPPIFVIDNAMPGFQTANCTNFCRRVHPLSQSLRLLMASPSIFIIATPPPSPKGYPSFYNPACWMIVFIILCIII